MMPCVLWIGVLAIAMTNISAEAAEAWKPAEGPLMTRWAKDVDPNAPLPEYPRPQMKRDKWMNLNGLWQFAQAAEGEKAPIGNDLAERILVPFPVESALSGVMKRADRVWYRRTFDVPADWKGQRVLLHFGAVDWESTVWVNGKEMGVHRGGYDGFSYDITDALKSSGSQEIVVGVFDPTDEGDQPLGKQRKKPEGIWYTPITGIWQTVWLEPAPDTRVKSLKMVPDVDNGVLRLTVEGSRPASVKAVAKDGSEVVATVTGRAGTEIEVPVKNARLWTPETPVLYTLRITLEDNGRTLDTVDTYFGMRKVSVEKDEKGINRLFLNGKPVFHNGPLDQGFWPDGLYTAPTDEALKYDIEITKELGFNTSRKHVKVEPARWYYWCDKMGLLVWQDMPSAHNRTMESRKQYETELRQMVKGLWNHPSIVMWVVFNEGWGQYDTVRVTRETEKLDPSRLVNNASGWTDAGAGDVMDIHVYPGPDSPAPEEKRAAVLGEFGGLALQVPDHMWTKEFWGYAGVPNSEALTERYERLYRRVWRLKEMPGMSASIYTQITDVETECNGLLTYDRAVIKVDVDRVRAANTGANVADRLHVVVPTSIGSPFTWRYTTEAPGEGWEAPGFDDKGWKSGPAGFGRPGTPGSSVRTVWESPDIWIRRDVDISDLPSGNPVLLLHHDEDAEVYVNGKLVAKPGGFTQYYDEVPFDAKDVLKPGKNTIAIHCKNTTGGQYIDAGIGVLVKP